MHRSTMRRGGRSFRFFHQTSIGRPREASAADLADALWDLVASIHLNPAAAEDESIRLMVRRAVRLLERGRTA
jgi:hypothetical protein